MITSVKPMTINHARALATSYELHRLLSEINDGPGGGEGSAFESALDLMDDVIARLEPSTFDGTEPAPLVGIVRRRALHSLTTKRWRP